MGSVQEEGRRGKKHWRWTEADWWRAIVKSGRCKFNSEWQDFGEGAGGGKEIKWCEKCDGQLALWMSFSIRPSVHPSITSHSHVIWPVHPDILHRSQSSNTSSDFSPSFSRHSSGATRLNRLESSLMSFHTPVSAPLRAYARTRTHWSSAATRRRLIRQLARGELMIWKRTTKTEQRRQHEQQTSSRAER